MTDPVVTVGLLRGELLELRAAGVEADGSREPCGQAIEVARPSEGWHRWAACRGRPVGWWFPAKGDVWLTRAAISVCEGCGVRDACLEAALTEEAEAVAAEVSGIRGGMTATARAVMLRRRRAARSA